MKRTVLMIFTLLFASSAFAEVCDFRPSKRMGKTITNVVAGISTTTAATGVGLRAAGFYVLKHASSGATMLGSTLAGESAAGTVGIIAGTGSGIGAVAGFLMSTPVIVTASAVAGTIIVFEGGCEIADRLQ